MLGIGFQELVIAGARLAVMLVVAGAAILTLLGNR